MKVQTHTLPRFLWRWLLIASFVGAACLLSPLRPAPAQQQSNPPGQSARPESNNEGKVTVSTEVISLTVSVTDPQGRFISGLEKRAFEVYENKVAQEISFFGAEDGPASVGIVFDLSGSMHGEKIRHAQEALARFIQTCHPEDDYCLIGFNQRAEVLVESTRDSESLLARLSGIEPRGDTALYDAVALGLGQVVHGKWPKRALIVISDGEDNNSRVTFKKIRQMVKEADVTIYTILIKGSMPHGIGQAVLGTLAETSGGQSFNPENAEQMSEAFEKIALELRRLYSLGYVPASFVPDGKWRKLKVRVTPPPDQPLIVVRTRMGYYAVPDRARRDQNAAGLDN